MNSTPFDLILGQSYLHLVSYGLVIAILFVALADAFLIGNLRRALRSESVRLKEGEAGASDLAEMVHPIAALSKKAGDASSAISLSTLQRRVDMADAALFVPLRARMALTRDLSTLMGLIATLLALVAAAAEFARNGQPERLIGSVGTGCVATCVAAIGCAIALWNLSRLTRLRLEVAVETEQVLLEMGEPTDSTVAQEVPIHYSRQLKTEPLNSQAEVQHASL